MAPGSMTSHVPDQCTEVLSSARNSLWYLFPLGLAALIVPKPVVNSVSDFFAQINPELGVDKLGEDISNRFFGGLMLPWILPEDTQKLAGAAALIIGLATVGGVLSSNGCVSS
ncbi:hypothetical protein QVA66_04790 [Staphylococcus chromogenes]|nr:hypothetical protein [Staphylococcus chromogenes]